MISPFSISRVGIGLGPKYISALGFKDMSTQDGRSGYWRLFYYQLQEAELEKDKLRAAGKPQQKEAPEKAHKPVVAAPERRVLVQRHKPKHSNTQILLEKPPEFKPKKLYLVPKREDTPDLVPIMNVLSNEVRNWALQSQELSVKFKQAQQLQAANEEEELITLLLLAA
jgi:hypothetical protein